MGTLPRFLGFDLTHSPELDGGHSRTCDARIVSTSASHASELIEQIVDTGAVRLELRETLSPATRAGTMRDQTHEMSRHGSQRCAQSAFANERTPHSARE
jgi:hypothetical protein